MSPLPAPPRRLFVFPLLVLLGWILSGCAGGVDVSRRAAAKRIGVLSFLGDKVHSENFGITAFEGKSYDAPAPDFRVDDTAAGAALSTLRSANPGAEPVNLQSERGSVHLPEASALALMFGGPGLPGEPGRIAEETSRRLAAKYKLDLVVLIIPRAALRRNENAPINAGYGFYGVTIFGDHRDVHVYVNYAVGAFDGATGKLLSLRLESAQEKVQGIKWRASLEAYSRSERSTLGFATGNMMILSVEKQLQRLGLSR